MSKTLFEKIIDREMEANILYEDELCIAIEDINPQAPTHILLITKKVIPTLLDAVPEDEKILGHLMIKATEIAKKHGLNDDCRFVINNGEKAGQSVFHLHLHILGGRQFNWPAG